jgi:hypothetical protein
MSDAVGGVVWVWFCSRNPDWPMNVSAVSDDEYDSVSCVACGAPLVRREYVLAEGQLPSAREASAGE